MSFPLQRKQASLLWIEPHRLTSGGKNRPLYGSPDEEHLALSLRDIPAGPTSWVVDDAWVPSVVIRDIVEMPQGTEARESFFRWKFNQALALDTPHAVQALDLGDHAWLLAGLPETRRNEWLQLATKVGRPIFRLVPRWLWLYNRLAAGRDRPGMLLSLCPHPEGGYTGTLAAWGRTLVLLRHWTDPASAEAWNDQRVMPSAAFLQRESRPPQELWIWGAPVWPQSTIPERLIQSEIPATEAL